jgi:cytochrome c
VEQFDVSVKKGNNSRETGLLGITADPDFMSNGWIYAYYSPKKAEEHRLARFTFKSGKLSDEKILLKIPQSRGLKVCHEGGSLAFDGKGNLFLSTGDNSNPFAAKGYPPLDESDPNVNAQRSSGNTNDLRGKVLRIRPTSNGGYAIPKGNLFKKGTAKTRPEIFAMGCRNPWRIGADQRTGAVYWGDVGPDARKDGPRGPKGYCEINQAAVAGNYGWPYFVADNKAYASYDFETKEVGEKFDAEKPVNASKLNTGIEILPAAQEPLWFAHRSSYCAGPVYYSGDHDAVDGTFPKKMDGCLITYDWNNGRMQLTKLDGKGGMEWKEDFLKGKKFIHPSDVEIGADGTMYVLEYGSGWYDSNDGKLKLVTYSDTKLETEGETSADPRLAGLDMNHPGASLLSEATCLSCHQTQNKSIGPRYVDVAERYMNVKGADLALVKKILGGGVGVWGDIPMPAHPQYNEEQVSQMVGAILSLDTGGHKE